jgi:TonB family protein
MKKSMLLPSVSLLFGCSAALPAFAAVAPQVTSGYTVTVDIKLNEKGEAQSANLVNSGDGAAGEVLGKVALAMASKTKLPAQVNGHQTGPVTVRTPFFFAVKDDEGALADRAPKPTVKDAVQPIYPRIFEKGVAGGAILEVVVGADGALTSVKTLRASNDEFARAATSAVKSWTFAPAQLNGRAVESRTRLAVAFDTKEEMAALEWRVAPRPQLASIVVSRPEPVRVEYTSGGSEQRWPYGRQARIPLPSPGSVPLIRPSS